MTAWTMTQITSLGIDVRGLDKWAQAFRPSAQTCISLQHYQLWFRKIFVNQQKGDILTMSLLSVWHKNHCFVSDESWCLICIITPLILLMALHFILLWCLRCLLKSVTVTAPTLILKTIYTDHWSNTTTQKRQMWIRHAEWAAFLLHRDFCEMIFCCLMRDCGTAAPTFCVF